MADLTLTLAGPLGPTVGASGSRLYYPGETANGANAESFRAGDIRDGTWQETFTFAGDPVAGEVVTLTFASPKIVRNINAGPITVTYTVQSGDTLSTLAANVADAINGAGMTPFGVGAAASAGVVTVTYIALLAIVFTGSNTVLAPPPAPVVFDYELSDYAFAQSVQVSPDNSYLYVQCLDAIDFSGVVIKVRLSDGVVVASQTFAGDANWNPAPIIINSTGTRLYGCYESSASFPAAVAFQLDTASMAVSNSVVLNDLPTNGASSIGLSDNGATLSLCRHMVPLAGPAQDFVGFTLIDTTAWTFHNSHLSNEPVVGYNVNHTHLWDADNAHIWSIAWNGNVDSLGVRHQAIKWDCSADPAAMVTQTDLDPLGNFTPDNLSWTSGAAAKSGSAGLFAMNHCMSGDAHPRFFIISLGSGSGSIVNPGVNMSIDEGGAAAHGGTFYILDTAAPGTVRDGAGGLIAALTDPNGFGAEWEGLAASSDGTVFYTAFDDLPLWVKGQAI